MSSLKRVEADEHVLWALCSLSLLSVFLYVVSAMYYGAGPFWFLNWNLILAWLPLFFAVILVDYLKKNRWFSPIGACLTLLWLTFLPNSFYIISDFIHLGYANSTHLLYYAIMLFAFSLSGLLLGYISLYLVHKQLLKRTKAITAHALIATILLMCSFAIYLGRYLRWNTWDIVLHPIGVVFDVSNRFIDPGAYGQTFQVTSLFFIFLSCLYFSGWQLMVAVKKLSRS